MKGVVLLLAFSAYMLSQSAFAGDMGNVASQTKWPWVSSISFGPVWQSNGNTQTFYLAPAIEKTYAANWSTNALTYQA